MAIFLYVIDVSIKINIFMKNELNLHQNQIL